MSALDKLSQIGETSLISLLTKKLPRGPATIVGVGDDAAAIRASGYQNIRGSEKCILLTTDTLVERVDFKRKTLSFFLLGQKALLANISDIAAMGGVPTYVLVTLGLPKNLQVKAATELYQGIKALAKKEQITIVGGDTTDSAVIFVSITLLGEVSRNEVVLRSGAKVGDLIWVTGKFGGPAAHGFKLSKYKFKSRIKEGRIIAQNRLATAMIDSSDGLIRSITELCKASRVGALIEEDKVPRAPGASLKQALYGGEEYELVFTAPKNKLAELKKRLKNITVVGEIVDQRRGLKLLGKDGCLKAAPAFGYQHFVA